jgi:hypothetical protein
MPTCVVDSCSFLHSFHLELDGWALSDLLRQAFEVAVHPEVVKEITSVLPRAYPQWKEKGLVSEQMSEIRGRHSVWLVNAVEDADYKNSKILVADSITRLDEGEKASLQLAIDASGRKMEYVFFFSDDYAAGQAAEELFDIYQCGYVVRSADLITFFGLRLALAKREIHQALRSLLAFYTDEFELARSALETALPDRSTVIVSHIDKRDFKKARATLQGMQIQPKVRTELLDHISSLESLMNGGIVAHIMSRIHRLDQANT